MEQDLLTIRDGQETYLPYMLGKLLNTLSNDRNTNHTNWLNALRRSYNRRVSMRSENPFYQYLIVPDSVVRKELELEKLAKQQQGSNSSEGEGEEEDLDEEKRKGIFKDEEDRLRLAEGKKPLKEKSSSSSSGGVKKEEEDVGAAQVSMSGSTGEARVPLQENAFNDGFNAELADLVAQDAATTTVVKQEENGNGNGNGNEGGEEQFWEEQRAVEWKDLSLETKVSPLSPSLLFSSLQARGFDKD